MIPAVQGNTADLNGITTAAKDQTVRIPIAPADELETITPGPTPADSGDNVMTYTDITMDQYKAYPIRYESEEELSLGGQYQGILQQQFEQGFRAFSNAIETDLAELYKYGCRAYGTAGTTPFASDLSAAAQMKKILDDNGCPSSGRSLVCDTTAGANMRTLANLTANYAAGTDATLRQGTLLPLMNFDIKESAQIQTHTKGTATGFDCTAIEPVGETTIACDGSDSGTVLAGDVVTRGNEGGSAVDGNKYIVYSGSTLTGNASGNFILNNPGLRLATTVADEWTIGNSYTANMAFHRNAIVLATRQPKGGDAAVDEMIITDPLTGISFRLAKYPQYMRNKLEIQLLWGVKVIKPEFVAVLLG
ncbi:MAG: P22 phage major capsid protein family protein [Ignavibacteria bacterium]